MAHNVKCLSCNIFYDFIVCLYFISDFKHFYSPLFASLFVSIARVHSAALVRTSTLLCLFSILACTDISVKCEKPLLQQLLSEIRRQQISACISIVFMLFCFYFSGILLPENIILGGGRSVRISPPKDQFSALRSELFQPVLLFCILLCRFKKGMMPLTTR